MRMLDAVRGSRDSRLWADVQHGCTLPRGSARRALDGASDGSYDPHDGSAAAAFVNSAGDSFAGKSLGTPRQLERKLLVFSLEHMYLTQIVLHEFM